MFKVEFTCNGREQVKKCSTKEELDYYIKSRKATGLYKFTKIEETKDGEHIDMPVPVTENIKPNNTHIEKVVDPLRQKKKWW